MIPSSVEIIAMNGFSECKSWREVILISDSYLKDFLLNEGLA
jgi:hypothetical protein